MPIEALESRVLLSSVIQSGERVSGNLNGQLDSYTFAGGAGGSIVVAMGGNGSNLLGSHIQLFGPDGKLVKEDRSDAGLGASLTAAAQITGTYTVVASSWNGASGRYNLSATSIGGGTPTPTPGSISGRVYLDSNQNGSLDAGEPALSNWSVYTDQNDNGLIDAGEASVLSAADGTYALSGLLPGTYHIRERVQTSFTRTEPSGPFPAGGVHVVALSSGANVSGKNFGNIASSTTPTPVTPTPTPVTPTPTPVTPTPTPVTPTPTPVTPTPTPVTPTPTPVTPTPTLVTPTPTPPVGSRPLQVAVSDSLTGLATGDVAVLQQSPLIANLRVHNELSLWFAVNATHSAGGGQLTPLGVSANLGLIAPTGDVTYTATFQNAGDAATIQLSINSTWALVANLADILLPYLNIPVTPEAIAAIASDLGNLAGAAKANQRLLNLPESSGKRLKTIVKTANDLRQLVTDRRQAAVVQQAFAKLGVQVSQKAIKKILKLELVKNLISKIASQAVLMIQTGGQPVIERFTAEQT
jgi:cell division septation protein DedD